jgi:hypothetical protein
MDVHKSRGIRDDNNYVIMAFMASTRQYQRKMARSAGFVSECIDNANLNYSVLEQTIERRLGPLVASPVHQTCGMQILVNHF